MIHNYSKFLCVATLLLIVAGGLVTSTGSGLSVPDWPLSYGRFFPPMVGGIRFEHTHRVIAGGVGLLTFAFLGLLLKNERRRWVRWLGAAAVLAVTAQAVLGGLTVIYLLPTVVSAAHACVGQTFFALLASIALCTSKEWAAALEIQSEESASLKRLAGVTVLFVYFQLVAGAVVRHTGGQALPTHAFLAFLIAMHVLFMLVRVLRNPALRLFTAHVLIFASLVTTQVFLGIGAYFLTLGAEKTAQPGTGRVLLTTAHQSVGALILAAAVLLMLRLLRLVKPKAAA